MRTHSPFPAAPWFTCAALGWLLAALAAGSVFAADPGPAPSAVVIDPAAPPLERFAARELQRYVYLRTGRLLPITPRAEPGADAAFVVASASDSLARSAPSGAPLHGAQDYRLVSTPAGRPAQTVWILGGGPVGALYGVYRTAEHLGVRFYLHRDVVPDERIPFVLPSLDESGHPLFSVRGILPFHDFAEGPDWWNTDDYLAIIGQLAKLRMNFIGLHTYPDSDVGPEPTVWIGPRGDYDARGRVRDAYPASYHTTERSGKSWWTYAPTPTSAFLGGAAQLYDRDDYGSDVMRGESFARQDAAGSVRVFDRTAAMLRTAFSEANHLGVLTCLGTETPLTVPAALAARLKAAGHDPADPAVRLDLYEGIFERIDRACPADYYWLWTPENWTWEGNNSASFSSTEADIRTALAALKAVHSPMTLATCGWVLGPQNDRAALDRLLPPDSPMSAINQGVGYAPIDRQFANLGSRPRWAIPWMENDGYLTSPELWVGRMRYDAADALRLGCTGLIGIHWRTKMMAPAVSALASAAWDQSWVPASFNRSRIPPQTTSGAIGGRAVAASIPVPNAPEALLTDRVGMSAYDMLVPNGLYTVKLGFSDPQGGRPGSRLFDVLLQGKPVIHAFDPAADAAGRTFSFPQIRVDNAHLVIAFRSQVGEPCIASIEIDGTADVGHAAYSRRINCGGPAYADFEADQLDGRARPPEDRTMPIDDFYRDFARVNFGPSVADAAGDLFARIDGTHLPAPSYWIDGPGDIRRDPTPWGEMSAKYAFVEDFAALRPQVRGSANLNRFDYWLDQFKAMRCIAELGCTAGALDRTMTELAAVSDPAAAARRAETDALPLRLRLAALWTRLLHTEIAGASTSGELGTIANLEQRSRIHQHFLDRHDAELVRLLGHPLPPTAAVSDRYDGPSRLIVPTVRTAAAPGERIVLRVLVAAPSPEAQLTLRWRPLGGGDYASVAFHHVARAVYEVDLPAVDSAHPAFEYHIDAIAGTRDLRWPISDHGANQSVVLGDSE